MAGSPRDVAADDARPCHVVEDEQPALIRLAHAQRVEHETAGVVAFLGVEVLQAEPSAEADEGTAYRVFLIGPDPPHHVIVAAEPVCVFSRDLCFADAAEPVERLGWLPDDSRAARC